MTLSRHLLALALALGALPLTGCEALLVAALEGDEEDDDEYESDDWSGESWSDTDSWGGGFDGGGVGWANEEALTVAGSELSGSGGDTRSFSGGVWYESGARAGTEYDVIQVEARNREAGWKSMVIVTVWGTLDHEAFAIGSEQTFDVWDPYATGTVDGNPMPDVLGCSGPADEDAEYDWDENADRVDVTVKESDTPGMKRVDMVATYESGATVEFSFDVATTLADEPELDEEVTEEGIGTEPNGIGDGGI